MRKISIFCYWFICFSVIFLSLGNAQETSPFATQKMDVLVKKYVKNRDVASDVAGGEVKVYANNKWSSIPGGFGTYKTQKLFRDKCYPINVGGGNIVCPDGECRTDTTGDGKSCRKYAVCCPSNTGFSNPKDSTNRMIVIYYKY